MSLDILAIEMMTGSVHVLEAQGILSCGEQESELSLAGMMYCGILHRGVRRTRHEEHSKIKYGAVFVTVVLSVGADVEAQWIKTVKIGIDTGTNDRCIERERLCTHNIPVPRSCISNPVI